MIRIFTKLTILVSVMFLFTSCGVKVDGTSDELGATISGRVITLDGVIAKKSFLSMSAYAAPTCNSDVYVNLHELTSQGEVGVLVESKLLTSDTKFSFNASSLKNLENVDYILQVTGCDEVYYRPITGHDG